MRHTKLKESNSLKCLILREENELRAKLAKLVKSGSGISAVLFYITSLGLSLLIYITGMAFIRKYDCCKNYMD